MNHTMSFANNKGWNVLASEASIEYDFSASCEGMSCGESDLVFIFSFNKYFRFHF